jgi:hypothetical protein
MRGFTRCPPVSHHAPHAAARVSVRAMHTSAARLAGHGRNAILAGAALNWSQSAAPRGFGRLDLLGLRSIAPLRRKMRVMMRGGVSSTSSPVRKVDDPLERPSICSQRHCAGVARLLLRLLEIPSTRPRIVRVILPAQRPLPLPLYTSTKKGYGTMPCRPPKPFAPLARLSLTADQVWPGLITSSPPYTPLRPRVSPTHPPQHTQPSAFRSHDKYM